MTLKARGGDHAGGGSLQIAEKQAELVITAPGLYLLVQQGLEAADRVFWHFCTDGAESIAAMQ
jgi:hypothetical protein